MKCRIMRHFIWVFTVCQSTNLGASTIQSVKHFSTSHYFYRLHSHLLMFLGRLFCKHYVPRSDFSLESSLIRVHSVYFNDKILSEVYLNIWSRRKNQTTLSGENIDWMRAKTYIVVLSKIVSVMHFQ